MHGYFPDYLHGTGADLQVLLHRRPAVAAQKHRRHDSSRHDDCGKLEQHDIIECVKDELADKRADHKAQDPRGNEC